MRPSDLEDLDAMRPMYLETLEELPTGHLEGLDNKRHHYFASRVITVAVEDY